MGHGTGRDKTSRSDQRGTIKTGRHETEAVYYGPGEGIFMMRKDSAACQDQKDDFPLHFGHSGPSAKRGFLGVLLARLAFMCLLQLDSLYIESNGGKNPLSSSC
jgi:hypothetical protein